MSLTYASGAMPLPKYAWDFNGTTKDYVSGQTGTTTGQAPFNSSGKYGQSVIIRNDNDASFANSLSYSFTTPVSTATGFTISCWVKFLKLPVGSGVGFNGRMALFAGYPFYFYILNGNYGIYGFYSSYILPGGGNCQNYQTDLTTPSTGVWYHVTYTFGQGASSVYFNGTLKRTAPYVGDSTMGNITIANNNIPSDQSGSFELDDLRIFDRALTSAQVQSVFNQQGMPGRVSFTENSYIKSGLVAYYDTQNWHYPNSVQGTTWSDISGNNRSVTIRSGSSYVSNGKYITFDGTINSGTTVAESGQNLTQWTVMCAFMQTANGTGFARIAGSSPTIDVGEFALYGQALSFNSPEQPSWTYTPFTTTYNVWYHMCIAFDTTTTGVIDAWVYINGALVNSYTIDGTVENLTGYTIGARKDFNNEAMIGRMSLFAIYNRVLSPSEVSANYEFYKKPQINILDPSFESYFSLIGAPGFLYAPSPSSWTFFSNGDAHAVAIKSGNLDWGAVPAQNGQVFLGLQMVQSISQTISGLVPGGGYNVTWWQRARPTKVGNDINVSLGGTLVYNETNITVSSSWTQRTSSSWISPGTSVVLQFYTTNPLGTDTTTFIDNVSISRTFVPIQLTGTPLFNQLSQAARSSAVGAFSLRAVNGTTAKAVQVVSHPTGIWPPVAMTSNITTATGTFNGVTNGVYTASESPNAYAGQNGSYQAFDSNPTGSFWHSGLTYNADGSYNGTTTQPDGYTGEWLQIQFPTPIILYSYSMIDRFNLPTRSPKNFKIYGSNDGTNWTIIDTQANITQWLWPARLTFTVTNPVLTAYSYFRLVVNAAIGANSIQISSWVLNGPAAVYTTGSPTDFYADRLGNLLTAPVTGQPLVKWLGGATGYVTSWYDQSGAGNHMTAAVQPVLSTATKPASIVFTGTEYFQNTIPFTFNFGSGAFTLRYVVSNNTGGVVLYKANGSDFVWSGHEKKFWLGNGTTAEASRGGFPSQVGHSEDYIYTASAIGSTKTSVVHKATSTTAVPIYVNGTLQTLGRNTINMDNDPGNFLYFGKGGAASNYIGNLHEIQIFGSAFSDPDRLALEN